MLSSEDALRVILASPNSPGRARDKPMPFSNISCIAMIASVTQARAFSMPPGCLVWQGRSSKILQGLSEACPAGHELLPGAQLPSILGLEQACADV
jgi:hypothetical protein